MTSPTSLIASEQAWRPGVADFREPSSAVAPHRRVSAHRRPEPADEQGCHPLLLPQDGATIVYMTVEPLRDVRNHFSDVVDRVEHEHERVTVTRNGRPVAVIISPEDLDALEETLAVLSDPHALADIREADAAYADGDVIRGADAVRALRP
jgi:antitoxin YefM